MLPEHAAGWDLESARELNIAGTQREPLADTSPNPQPDRDGEPISAVRGAVLRSTAARGAVLRCTAVRWGRARPGTKL